MDSVIYDKLKEVAAAGDTITYGEVGRLVGLAVGNPGHLSDLSWRLGEISEEEVAEGRPMLSAVVVTRETSRPGQGFLPEGRRLKPDEAAQSDDFWRDEVRRVWSYWKGVTDGSGKSNLLPRAVRTALNETFPAIIRANYVSDDEWRQQRDDPRDCYAKAFKKHLDNEIDGWFLPPGYVSIQEGEHSHTWIFHNRPASDGSHETASRRGSIDQVHVELQLSPDLHRPESIASHPHGAASQVAQTDFVADSGKVESRYHFACVLVPCRPPCKDDLEETVLETIERTKESATRAFGVNLTRQFYQVLLGWPWTVHDLRDAIDPGEYALLQVVLCQSSDSSAWKPIQAPAPHRLQITPGKATDAVRDPASSIRIPIAQPAR